MKRIIISTFMLLVSTIYSQKVVEQKKVETKFLRPSVIEVYGASKIDANKRKVLSLMSEIPLQRRFNDLGLGAKLFENTPLPPEKNYFDAVKGLFSKKRNLKPEDVLRDKTFQPALNKLAKDAIAKWYSRDSNGDFSVDYIKQRGLETSTDEDYEIKKASFRDKRMDLGNRLISRTYVFIYDVNTLYREKKGDLIQWNADYTARVYKLVWDGATKDKMRKLWTTKTNHNQERVNQWSKAEFSFEFVDEIRGNASASTILDKSDNDLLAEVAKEIKKESIFKITNKVDDLKTKSSIYKEKPITAKIGTKEGLYIDQRYFAYDIVIDKDNNQKKKRRGVLRVHKVANDDGIAEGHTKASVFTQQGGHRLYNGMLIELNEDRGIVPNIGYTKAFGNNALSGISGGVDYRISDIFKQLRGISALKNSKFLKKMERNVIPGIYAGAHVTLNSFKDLQYGPNKLSGMTWFIEGRLSKEFYFTRKGNIYAQPYVGFGFSAYTISKLNGIEITDKNNKPSISAFALPFGVKIGYNIHPAVNIAIVPGAVKTFQYKYYTGKNDKEGTPLLNLKEDKQGFGFDKFEGALNLRATVIVRIRI